VRKRHGDHGPCTHEKGWGTPHPGEGTCRKHGGLGSARAALVCTTHGRYSKLQRPRIRELIEQYEKDPDPLNLLAELAALRAHYQDFVERWDETSHALVAWWQSWSLTRRAWTTEELRAFRELLNDFEERFRTESTELTAPQQSSLTLGRAFVDALAKGHDKGRPKQILDLGHATQMLVDIAKVVERIERMRNSKVISQMELFRVMGQMGEVVKRQVSDPETAQRIIQGWHDLLVQAT
jgi:hypothetical protein